MIYKFTFNKNNQHSATVSAADIVDYVNIKATVALLYCQILDDDKLNYQKQAEGDDVQPSQKHVRTLPTRASRDTSPSRKKIFSR